MGKDSSKPRGKTSPYGFFVKMCYEEHKKKYPNENVQVTEISKKCSEKWKTMTDAEKRRFYELAQKDAERYQAEVAAYGGDTGKRKMKMKKDPNAPKRALSAFFFFSQEKRSSISSAHPDYKVGQVAQELGKMWKEMTDVQKKVYEEMATRDKGRYEIEMKDYKAGKPIAGRGAAGGASTSAVRAPAPAAQYAAVAAANPQQQQMMAHMNMNIAGGSYAQQAPADEEVDDEEDDE